MAQPGLSTGAKVTEFLSPEQLEASARRSQCGQRASKITGQRFLALGTFGRWRRPKPSLAQLAAKAAQGEQPVAGTPAARDQRRNSRALAFLQELLQSAFPQRHTGDPVCAEALFAPCARGPLAESTGFGLPESLQAQVPGAGGSGAQAGAKLQLVGDYTSPPFAHCALTPCNVPDNKYVATVTELARPHSLGLFAPGSCKLAALAPSATAHAYFRSRLNPHTPVLEVRDGRGPPLDLPRVRAPDLRPGLEKAVLGGARDRGAARLSAGRRPDASVNERRRQARAGAKKRGDTPAQAPRTLLAWKLFSTNVPGPVWPPQTVGTADALSGQGARGVKSWKSPLPLATRTTTTKHSPLG